MDKSGIFFVALLLVLVAIVLSLALFHSPQQSPALPSGEGLCCRRQRHKDNELLTDAKRLCARAPSGLTAFFKTL